MFICKNNNNSPKISYDSLNDTAIGGEWSLDSAHIRPLMKYSLSTHRQPAKDWSCIWSLRSTVVCVFLSPWTFNIGGFFNRNPSTCCVYFRFLSADPMSTQMEVLRCFNCDHTGRRHEDFFNITKIHPSFAEKADSESEEHEQDKFLRENAFLVCGDCVYDRLQECHSCAKKAPLCMFKIAEWFTDKKNRICIDCAATLEALGLFQTGYHSSVIIRQCSVCRHFKYLPSFISWRKHLPHETLKDCFECQLRRDIVQYKRKVRDRYEEKLQQEPVLGDDIQPSRTGGKERFGKALAQQGATYASVVSKGFTNGKSSYTKSDEGHLGTKQNTAHLNVPIESGQQRGKSLSTGLEGKRRRTDCRCFPKKKLYLTKTLNFPFI